MSAIDAIDEPGAMFVFPAGNAKIEKAIDSDDQIIGVSIILLVFPEDFDKLPDILRKAAHRTYAAPRT